GDYEPTRFRHRSSPGRNGFARAGACARGERTISGRSSVNSLMSAGGTIGTWSMLALLASAAPAQVDQQRAQEFFKEAQALCERDGGRLWGVSLCGPMVIADRRTQ